MKLLLIFMGLIEAVTGLGLLAFPSLLASLLLGSPLEGAAGQVVARVCGAALLSLGIACFRARIDANSQAASGLIIAMLVYNTIATAVLVYSFFGLRLMGIALWPAIVVHAALAIWCLAVRFLAANSS